MKRTPAPMFQPSSSRARAVFAVAAVLVSLLVGNAIDGLVDHYQAGAQMAATPAPMQVAQR